MSLKKLSTVVATTAVAATAMIASPAFAGDVHPALYPTQAQVNAVTYDDAVLFAKYYAARVKLGVKPADAMNWAAAAAGRKSQVYFLASKVSKRWIGYQQTIGWDNAGRSPVGIASEPGVYGDNPTVQAPGPKACVQVDVSKLSKGVYTPKAVGTPKPGYIVGNGGTCFRWTK